MDTVAFRVYVNKLTYDKTYQDIEYINTIGYAMSFRTWNHIRNLVQWKDKRVADLGCFHGYFTFKVAKEGAKAVGFDRSPEVLKTTEILNKEYGNIAEFRQWTGGEALPEEFDVALILNVLHHFADPRVALEKIPCKTVIFEVQKEQLPLIEEFYSFDELIESHRAGRIIVLGERR